MVMLQLCMCFNKVISWLRGRFFPPQLGKYVIYLSVILIPILIYPISINGNTVSMRGIREAAFLSFAFVICSFLQKNKWLSLFLIWCIANWWLNFFQPFNSFFGLVNILSAYLIYVGFKFLLKNKIVSSNVLIYIICSIVIFQALWMIMQMFNFDPVFYPVNTVGDYLGGKMPLVGWSGNPSLLGIFFASFSFLFLAYMRKFKIPIIFITILILSLFIKNFTTLLCYCAGVLFYTFCTYKNKKLFVLSFISIALLIAGVIWIKKPNFDRLYIWGKMIKDGLHIRPFVGSGVNFFSNLHIVDKTGTPWKEAHNDYLQMLLELGIVGISLLSLFIISKFREFFIKFKTNKQVAMMCCLVGFLVSGVSLFPMHLAQMSFLAIIVLACLEDSYETEILPNNS